MTNNDEMAIKPVGNLFISDKCEVVFSPSKRPIAGFQFAGSVYSAEQVNALLAERDADKKRIAELEARTVSVKLPENTVLAEAPDHIWLQTAGEWPVNAEFSELTWCSDRQHDDDTLYVRADLAAGIKLEVGE